MLEMLEETGRIEELEQMLIKENTLREIGGGTIQFFKISIKLHPNHKT